MTHRVLTYVNLIGVIVMAILCGFQWQANGRATRAAEGADAARAAAVAESADRERALDRQAVDLDDARGKLATVEAAAADARSKFSAAADERDQWRAERDRCRTTLDHWSAAVVERDAALKKLAVDRDDAVGRYNGLVGKYNAIARGGGH